MNSTNHNSYINAALKVFSQLGQLIEDDEKLNNNHVLLHELPDDIMKKISNNLLDKNDKIFNKIFNESKDEKLLNILFVNYIPELKYIDPDIYNKYESNINLDCIKNILIKIKNSIKLIVIHFK